MLLLMGGSLTGGFDGATKNTNFFDILRNKWIAGIDYLFYDIIIWRY
jgi:hypothetical protein